MSLISVLRTVWPLLRWQLVTALLPVVGRIKRNARKNSKKKRREEDEFRNHIVLRAAESELLAYRTEYLYRGTVVRQIAAPVMRPI